MISKQCTIGLIPTMGALHAGHVSLIRRAQQENDKTVVSIFVNPTQFDRSDDFEKYPRPANEDLSLLKSLNVDEVFTPSVSEMYPDEGAYAVVENKLSSQMCGAFRPGHFSGMLTIVLKLLIKVRPTRAYFGEKDFQQLELVRGLVKAFFLETEIVGCPIIRESSQLACSSRNSRLSPSQREAAIACALALKNAPTASVAAEQIRALGARVDYVEEWRGRRLAAFRLGEGSNEVRLIDNVPLAGAPFSEIP